uniref:Uncharacterized protein n=1 Tax=Phenylobacterium glaciei TaxID=2803784 RepID=A0A974P515_9CAUL|nr:hypothetical protein JKL49_08060 [Phenylobacterium glaciei]
MPIAAVRFTVRRTLEAIRTLPDLVLALVLVAAFGWARWPGSSPWPSPPWEAWASCSPRSTKRSIPASSRPWRRRARA